MLNVLVCVSGGGTNLQAILDGIEKGTVRNAKVVEVISNNPGVYALERAKNAGVKGVCVSPKDYADREGFHRALMEEIDSVNPDLIVLAGFLVNIPSELVKKYPRRIINIHPSLIPSFCGKGYYGLKVHEAALARGVKVTGATVHIVDDGVDTGPILMQKAVEVQPGDTPEILQKRVMEQAEWVILPGVIDAIATGAISLEDGR